MTTLPEEKQPQPEPAPQASTAAPAPASPSVSEPAVTDLKAEGTSVSVDAAPSVQSTSGQAESPAGPSTVASISSEAHAPTAQAEGLVADATAAPAVQTDALVADATSEVNAEADAPAEPDTTSNDGEQADKPLRPEGIARAREVFIEIVRTAFQVAVLFIIISTLMGRYEIHQISMEPNFHEGERVIVSRLDWLWDTIVVRFAKIADPSSSPFQPNVGDVVVFKSPSGLGDALIKRVIGVPGDTIEIRDSQIWRNGELLDEPYINGLPTNCNSTCAPITLDADTFFVAGDNRPSSLDSRSFGPVPGENMIGRVIARYWPLNRLSIFF
jgi:signal peptidase I